MRYREFLFEYNRDITKKNFGEKLLMALKKERPKDANFNLLDDPAGRQQLIDDFIKQLEDADPTPNKEYVQWMARKYTDPRNLVKFEDYIGQLPEYLAKFHKLKQRRMIENPRNDINRYDNVPDFMNVIDEYPDPVKPEDRDKGQAKVFYEDNDLRIIVPQDKAAACYYGQGTRWCTASTVGINQFERYNRFGPLYIVIPKNPTYNGQKYQFSFPYGQFMDERDRSIDNEIGRELAQKYPQLYEIFNSQIAKHHTGYFLVLKFTKKELNQIINELKKYTVDMPNGSHIVYMNDHPDIEDIDIDRIKLAEFLVRRNKSNINDDWEPNDTKGELPILMFAVFNKDYTDVVFIQVDVNTHDIAFRTMDKEKDLSPEIKNVQKLFLKTMADYRKDYSQIFDDFTNKFIPQPLRIEAEEL